MRPSKMTHMLETAPESTEVASSTTPMFQSLKFPANRSKRLAKLLMFVYENPNVIAKNEEEMILEGKRLAGSNFDLHPSGYIKRLE